MTTKKYNFIKVASGSKILPDCDDYDIFDSNGELAFVEENAPKIDEAGTLIPPFSPVGVDPVNFGAIQEEEVMTRSVSTVSDPGVPSDTFNNSSHTPGQNISDEVSSENQNELLNYHQSILRIFHVGNHTHLNINDLRFNLKHVKDFYTGSTGEGGHPVRKCNFSAIWKDSKGFAKTPVAIGAIVKCHIHHNKSGKDHRLYPTYDLYLEDDRYYPDRLLLTARKRKMSFTSNYLISTDPAQVGHCSNAFIGKVRGNLLGTKFAIYDSGISPKRFNYATLGIDLFNYRQELGAVIYDANVFGWKGLHRMKLLIPSMLGESERFECRPNVDEETILEMNKKRHLPQGLVELRNKLPSWNAKTKSYCLNFNGRRVARSSCKNFQIIHSDKPDYIVLQFGRVDGVRFNLDIRYPLCPLQAFGIALTKF